MTYVDIISGFLGAGKTTFIKRILKDTSDVKTVLIENEFGEIGIDGGFLKDAGIEITEMNSGCICCSLVGDFKEALTKVVDELNPERIIIEPSGVGKLSDVIKAVEDAGSEKFMLRSKTTVVDAGKCKMYMKNFGEFFADQIANASAIVLSHTEKTSENKLAEAIEIVRNANDEAEIISTPYDKLSIEVLLSSMQSGKHDLEKDLLHEHHHHDEHCSCHDHEHHHHGEHCGCHDHEHHHHGEHCGCHDHEHHHHDEHCGCHDHEHHHHDEHCSCHDHDHHHHADEVFSSVGGETNKKYTAQEIEDFLSALESGKYGTVLRAKGYLPAENGFIHFDYVPGEPDVREGVSMPTGRYCVIGSDLSENEINELLRR